MTSRRDSPLPARYHQLEPLTTDGDLFDGLRHLSVPERARSRFRRRRLTAAVAGLIVIVFVWSLGGALTTPGNQSFSAKWADWLRAHHAGFAINHIEALYYSHNAPAKGGRPGGLNALPGASHTTSPSSPHGPSPLPPPAPIAPVVTPTLPGEGTWQAVGPSVGGAPGMYEAQFRADNIYTSQITSAVWIDPRLLKIGVVPGASEPGGTWTHPPDITTPERHTIAAAFNAGFRPQDARGGFYLDGRTAVPLRNGAASFVLYQDGHVNIGTWDREVTMAPNVVAVVQNLVPMVDNGQLSPSATTNDSRVWGSTLGAATIVARSGIGVTANGALVYVAGPALSARTLAESLQRAGATRAMTLDINPEWVTFNFYNHPNSADSAQITAAELYPRMQRPATRYLGPGQESREFFTVAGP
ncbi:MAG: phosphodiester glycosidase family protein [Acidimicrobiales bacterium]